MRKRSIELTFRTIVILILLLSVLVLGIVILTGYTSQGQGILQEIMNSVGAGKDKAIDSMDKAFETSDSSG